MPAFRPLNAQRRKLAGDMLRQRVEPRLLLGPRRWRSGWVRIRQRARQKNVELPLIISDHADWDELTATVREVAPKEVWTAHGREDALMHWCQLHQIKAVS